MVKLPLVPTGVFTAEADVVSGGQTVVHVCPLGSLLVEVHAILVGVSGVK
jgi:hypothetical protein